MILNLYNKKKLVSFSRFNAKSMARIKFSRVKDLERESYMRYIETHTHKHTHARTFETTHAFYVI